MKDLNLTIRTIYHCSLSEGKSSASQYDIVFCPLNFVSMFDDVAKKGVHVIGMKNVLSDKEAKEKLMATGILE